MQGRLQFHPGIDHGLHLRVEETKRVAPARLGLVHGQLSPFQRLKGIFVLLTQEGAPMLALHEIVESTSR